MLEEQERAKYVRLLDDIYAQEQLLEKASKGHRISMSDCLAIMVTMDAFKRELQRRVNTDQDEWRTTQSEETEQPTPLEEETCSTKTEASPSAPPTNNPGGSTTSFAISAAKKVSRKA